MSLDKLSIYLLEIIMKFLSQNEMKSLLIINQFFAQLIKHCLKINTTRIRLSFLGKDSFVVPHLQQLKNININTLLIKNQDVKKLLQSIPQKVVKLKIQLNYDLIAQQKFYRYITRYNQQIIGLKITAIGPNMIQTQQKQILQQFKSIDVKFLHNQFYIKMKNLEKFKVVTQGLSNIQAHSIQNYLFYALFYRDQHVTLQPTIQKISFDQLTDVSQLQQNFIKQENFVKNVKILQVEIKQYDYENQMNLLNKILLFTQLFGQQIINLKFCQHLNSCYELEWTQLKQFQGYFCNLQNFSLQIYNKFYSIKNFLLDEFAYKEMNSFGFSSISLYPQDLTYLLSLLRNIRSLNLDFTHLDNDGLLLINEYYDLKELKIRGCRKLTNVSLLPFFEKQKNIIVIDIRGVNEFSKKAFRLMTQNCLLEKLSISVNKLNNQVLENLLQKNSLSLTHLNIGEIMHNNGMSDDFFSILVKKNLKFLNLYSLSISLSYNGFSVSVIEELLQLIPFINVLSLRINNHHIQFLIEQITKHLNIYNSLEKLVFIGQGYFDLKINKNTENTFQLFRDKLKKLDSLTFNLGNAGMNFVNAIQSLFKMTKGHDLRVVFPQEKVQYIV